MPIGIETTQMKSTDSMVMTTVNQTRDPITSLTGRFQLNDQPRSPRRMMLPIHSRYWECSGRSNPYCCVRRAISSSASSVPEARRVSMSVVRKSPGGS